MWHQIIKWFEAHTLSCHFKSIVGFDCLGCGMQRSFIALLKGNIVESIIYYPALIPLMSALTYLGLHLIFRFKRGAEVLKVMFIVCVTIIVLGYIWKNFL